MNGRKFQVKLIRDVVYYSPSRELFADVYLPGGLQEPCAAIIWVHGGGWRSGDRHLAPDLRRFYAERGYAMVSIDYRLSSEATFPAPVQDLKTSVRWLKQSADSFGIDPKRIALWGSSAGAHLAALAAASGTGRFEGSEYLDQSSSVAGVVAGYAPVDFLQMDAHRDPKGTPSEDLESVQLPPGSLSTNPDSMESLFLGVPIQMCPERVQEANPITYVESGLPPFLLLHGTSDTVVPVHQSLLLFEALARTGNGASLVLVERLGHGFLTRNNIHNATWRAEVRMSNNGLISTKQASVQVFEVIGEWFDKHLQQRA